MPTYVMLFHIHIKIECDGDSMMKTMCVSMRGFQAPELLPNNEYDFKYRVFFAGGIICAISQLFQKFRNFSKSWCTEQRGVGGRVPALAAAAARALRRLPRAPALLILLRVRAQGAGR